ncbi:MAG TPA: hypothetical protein VFV58_06885 [Blastocatellia bacterium]|jgi:hypothetical protein|nr:hypothetical protein [Blastocatellia bacterium]
MKNHLKIHTVLGFAVVALLLAQLGCSSKSAENAVAVQPTPTPDTTAQASPSPTPEATPAVESAPAAVASKTGAKPRAVASNTGARSRSGDSSAESSQTYAPPPPPAREAAAPARQEYNPPPPRVFTIREGTAITISTAKTLTTKLDRKGDRFTASLANSIVDGDWVIAKRGALVEGEIVNSDQGGRVEGRAVLTVKLRSLQLADGRKVALATDSYTKEAKATKKKDAAKVGIGAGLGAAIGAIAGGGKGAAIGAAAGGGAGTGVVLATRGDPAEIPSESTLTFRIEAPITVTQRR